MVVDTGRELQLQLANIYIFNILYYTILCYIYIYSTCLLEGDFSSTS